MTTKILTLRSRARRRGPRVVRSTDIALAVKPAVVTRAELAECTCPDSCERDHEQD